MPRYNFAQTQGQSCGAVCAMVTLAELGTTAPASINVATEMQIWQNVWRGNGPSESPVAYVSNFFLGNGRQSQFYEDQGRIGNLMDAMPAMVAPYMTHREELVSTGLAGQVSPLLPEHFANNARILLVVIIAGVGLTHYVLARQENGGIWVMNPDGGQDTQQADLFAWVNGPAGGVANIGGVNYIFTGIFVRVV
ncbi:MAG: hypothetical protein QM749_14110 [Aquabacterium sp.]